MQPVHQANVEFNQTEPTNQAINIYTPIHSFIHLLMPAYARKHNLHDFCISKFFLCILVNARHTDSLTDNMLYRTNVNVHGIHLEMHFTAIWWIKYNVLVDLNSVLCEWKLA